MEINEVNVVSEVRQVYKYLEDNHLHVSLAWVEQCVDWFKQEHMSYNEDLLNKTVFEQWLLADLRDMEIGSLPQDITSFQKCILRGKYALQIEYVKDSSQSSYSQLQQIRNNHFYEIDSYDQNKNKSSINRVLSLYMCDGIQDVIGMEYQPIKSINKYLMPGVKVLICGPVVCRRGVLFLEEMNIKILGGVCEELTVKNANENILARYLNLPESSSPKYLISSEINKIENDILSNGDDDWLATLNFDQIENLVDTNVKKSELISVRNNSVSLISSVNKTKKNDNLEFEDDFLEYADVLDDNLSELFGSSEQINENIINTCVNPTLKLNTENLKQSFQICKYKIIDNEPFVYIKQLLEDNISSGSYIVKGRIKTLTKKLTFVKKWSLECIITDGSGCLKVLFDNSVLENLIGYSAKQMLVLQRQMINHYFYKDQVLQALEKMKNKLMILNALFEIEFTETMYATVINIRGINHSHLKQLQYRLNQ